MPLRDGSSRALAVAAGEKYYVSKTSCKRGHHTRRLTSSGSCVECIRITAGKPQRVLRKKERAAIYEAENLEALRTRRRELEAIRRLQNPSRALQKGRRAYQKYRDRISERNRQPENRSKRYFNTLRRQYGLTFEDYTKVLEEQKGLCAICRQTAVPDKKGVGLHLDHNHQTNKPRGLLCRRCNTMTGFLEKHLNLVPSAIQYLLRYDSLVKIEGD